MGRWGIVGAVVALLVAVPALPASAAAVSDCATPASLCSGDPCTTTTVTVAPTCALDFGARTLVIGGKMSVPNGGTLSLSAGAIEVKGAIEGGTTNGPNITLDADRTIMQRARVAAMGTATPGSITLRAGGDIETRNGIAAAASSGKTGRAGTITVESGGAIRCFACRLEARAPEGGAVVRFHAYGDITLPLGSHFDAGGRNGGTFTFVSDTGKYSSEIDGRFRVSDGTGPTYVVHAPGGIDQRRDLNVEGGRGGTIELVGGTVRVGMPMRANGKSGPGGNITVIGTSVAVTANPTTAGKTNAGRQSYRATGAGGLTLTGDFDARKNGTIVAVAEAGPLVATGKFLAAPTGCIAFAGVPLNIARATFDVQRQGSCP